MGEQGVWEAAAERPSRTRLLLAVVAVAAVAVAVWLGGDRPGGGDAMLPVDAAPAGGAEEASMAPEGVTVEASAAPDEDSASVTVSGTWTVLGDVPVPPSGTHHALWTGDELLVWGGDGTFGAFDPRASRWREAAPGPVRPVGLSPVWTGSEALVWAAQEDGSGLAGAAYAPGSDRWRKLPRGPLPALQSGAVAWTGREAVVWGRWGTRLKGGAAYGLGTGRWEPVPPGPVPRVATVAGVWTGRDLVVWGTTGSEVVVWGRRGPDGNPERSRVVPERFAAVYDPTARRWRLLPPPPLGDPAAAAAAWSGHEVMLFGGPERGQGPLVGAAIDPHDRTAQWRLLPPAPQQEAHGVSEVLQGVWTGQQFLAVGGRGPIFGWAYDPESERWGVLPATADPSRVAVGPPATPDPSRVAEGPPAIAWTGEHLLVVSAATGERGQLLTWRPE